MVASPEIYLTPEEYLRKSQEYLQIRHWLSAFRRLGSHPFLAFEYQAKSHQASGVAESRYEESLTRSPHS